MKSALIIHAVIFGFDAGAAALVDLHIFVAKLIVKIKLHEAAFGFVEVGRIHAIGEHIVLVLLGVEHVINIGRKRDRFFKQRLGNPEAAGEARFEGDVTETHR